MLEVRLLARWCPALFIAAGCCMLLQVFLIGLRRYNIGAFSESWIALPAIAALIASLAGQIGLYPRIAGQALRLARAGTAAAMAACMILCIAAVWLIGRALQDGIPQPPPGWFLVLIAAFMLAFILAFVLSAAASLWVGGSLRVIGCLLLVPVISWAIILVAGFMSSMNEALLLDFYTNGVIGVAFLAIGNILPTRIAS
jgi:hypothetical protein